MAPNRLRYRDELARLAAHPTAATEVLRLVEDPKSSAAQLARVIETDPALSVRVISMANSPYYGLSRQISSSQQAVVLLGFTTVRALAVSAACGLLDERSRNRGPIGFWPHAVATASATSVLASRSGTPTSDAFSVGLLHDIGSVLLHRRSPARFDAAQEQITKGMSAVLAAELRAFGVTHAQAGAAALEAWWFPPPFVEAVATHHGGVEGPSNPLGRLVRAGEIVSGLLVPTPGHEVPTDVDRVFAELRIAPERREDVLAEIETQITKLLAPLAGDGEGVA